MKLRLQDFAVLGADHFSTRNKYAFEKYKYISNFLRIRLVEFNFQALSEIRMGK